MRLTELLKLWSKTPKTLSHHTYRQHYLMEEIFIKLLRVNRISDPIMTITHL
jgi:hypothetical protein